MVKQYLQLGNAFDLDNKNTIDYYDAWIKDDKGNKISIDIEKIPREYIIDGLRCI